MAFVDFTFSAGMPDRNCNIESVRLKGSWNGSGAYAADWCETVMERSTDPGGSSIWTARIFLSDEHIGWRFHWGILGDLNGARNQWLITMEDLDGRLERHFVLHSTQQSEGWRLGEMRALGANKYWRTARSVTPSIRFSVWAPNALAVETVIGDRNSGYIFNDGRGILASFPMSRNGDGLWSTDPDDASLADFSTWDHQPYMFRVTRQDGSVAFRTDLYSRCQIGSGKCNPDSGERWDGRRQTLAGTKSCSVAIDPDRITARYSENVWPETEWLSDRDFWRNEFNPNLALPARAEDLIIYELHVGALGVNHDGPGTLQDAIDLLPHLLELGINAIELLPMSEYEGWASWGYGTSHYFAVEYVSGGRDQFKHFVRECHRYGIAVILDVVYNHFTHDGERAEWMYDSPWHDNNIYYWYEGSPFEYPNDNPTGHGGYLDNGSTGYTPDLRREEVRKLFISSALALMTEFHVDGFRMDLTQAIHRDQWLHADGRTVELAKAKGAQFLREWVRSLRLVRPNVILFAEDHTGWPEMVRSSRDGGICFDAVWYADWYHHLIGDSTSDSAKARLLYVAGVASEETPLAMDALCHLLENAANKVIYHESHDEAGNSSYLQDGQVCHSARTLVVAAGGDVDRCRRIAEARCRVVVCLTLLAPGIPMFFMAEEVGATNHFCYDDFLHHREDILSLRRGSGARLFDFYRDVIALRKRESAFRAHNVEVVHVHNANRVIAFRRWQGDSEFLVVANFGVHGFHNGYRLCHASLGESVWRYVFNSDKYAENNHVSAVFTIASPVVGEVEVVLPGCSVLVLERQNKLDS